VSPDVLDGADHVVRYCRPRTIDSQGRITAAAFTFRVRRKREEFLSVNWLEHFDATTRAKRMHLLREVLRKKLTLSKRGRLGVLQIGRIRDLALRRGTESVRLVPHRSKEDPSHAGIHVAEEQEMAAAAILANLVEEAFLAQTDAATAAK